MKNNNTLVFTCGNPSEQRPVDFETIYSATKLTDCYHLRLTNCYMEWNPVSFAKLEYFYMKPNDYYNMPLETFLKIVLGTTSKILMRVQNAINERILEDL